MLTLYQCKPTFQNWLRPGVNRLAKWRVVPNQITIVAMVLSIALGMAIALFPQNRWLLLLFPLGLLARMALNAIDGMLAREHHLTTPLGGILNELGDAISDVALYLPFSLIPGISAPWMVAIAILAVMTEMAGVLGLAIARKRCYQGPMGKSDRAFVFGAVALVLGCGVRPVPWFNGIWIGVVLLEIIAIVNRVRATLREVEACS